MKPIRFGVMGCASVAKRLVLPAMKKISNIRLIAVASRSESKAKEFAREFNCQAIGDYQSLINHPEIDAIYMPLPTGLHFEWAHKVLDAGKHLFIEKSLARNYLEAKSIIEKAEYRGLLITENYMFEYHSQQSEVKRLLRSKVGSIRAFRANFGFPPLAPNNFRYDLVLGGGALLDAGGYTLKALEVFFPGNSATVISASLDSSKGIDIAGSAMINVESEFGNFPCFIAFGFDHYYQCNIEAWGSKALLRTNRTFTAGATFVPTVEIQGCNGTKLLTLTPDDHFFNILSDFAHTIAEGDFKLNYLKILKQAKLQQDIRDADWAQKSKYIL